MSFLETQDTLDFIRVFGLLWQRCPSSLPPPLAVGVTLFHLTAAHNVTPNLPQLVTSRLALDQAMDKLNQCYGQEHSLLWRRAIGPQSRTDPHRVYPHPVPEKERA